jgi:hypothetical protein
MKMDQDIACDKDLGENSHSDSHPVDSEPAFETGMKVVEEAVESLSKLVGV